MIADTGTVANRAQWLQDAFSLVEPDDVRWIFLSHDDVDHTGNLDETLSACPNAALVCNWAMVERHTNCFEFPHERCRWVMDGETLDIGDRRRVGRRAGRTSQGWPTPRRRSAPPPTAAGRADLI